MKVINGKEVDYEIRPLQVEFYHRDDGVCGQIRLPMDFDPSKHDMEKWILNMYAKGAYEHL